MILGYAVVAIIAATIIKSIILRRDYLLIIGQRKYNGGWRLLAAVIVVLVQIRVIIFASNLSFPQIFLLNLCHIALGFIFLLNRHLPGVKWAMCGIALNLIVMVVNGGLMPVTPGNIERIIPTWEVEVGGHPPASKNIVLERDETRFWVLSDWIRIDIPGRCSAISVGDIFIIIGMIRFFLFSRPFRAPFAPFSCSFHY